MMEKPALNISFDAAVTFGVRAAAFLAVVQSMAPLFGAEENGLLWLPICDDRISRAHVRLSVSVVSRVREALTASGIILQRAVGDPPRQQFAIQPLNLQTALDSGKENILRPYLSHEAIVRDESCVQHGVVAVQQQDNNTPENGPVAALLRYDNKTTTETAVSPSRVDAHAQARDSGLHSLGTKLQERERERVINISPILQSLGEEAINSSLSPSLLPTENTEKSLREATPAPACVKPDACPLPEETWRIQCGLYGQTWLLSMWNFAIAERPGIAEAPQRFLGWLRACWQKEQAQAAPKPTRKEITTVKHQETEEERETALALQREEIRRIREATGLNTFHKHTQAPAPTGSEKHSIQAELAAIRRRLPQEMQRAEPTEAEATDETAVV